MQRKTLTLSLSALLLAFGSHAMAQTALQSEAPVAQKQTRAFQHKNFGKRQAQHQAQLQEKLQLRPDQQAAWDRFKQNMQRPQHAGKRAQRDTRSDELSTPERIAQLQARRAERQQAMDQRLQAVQAFYEQLDPEQKTIFDRETHHRHSVKRMRSNPAAQQG